MTKATHIRKADFRVMPWRNGLGETVEIARSPAGGTSLEDFGWRMSVAPVVADGAFSTFPGIDRTIVVIEGNGMELSLADGRTHRLLPGEPFTYDGGIPIHGTLVAGPVRDLNLMTRRTTHRGRIALADGHRVFPDEGGNRTWVAFAIAGDWELGGRDWRMSLMEGDALLVEEMESLFADPRGKPARLALAIIAAG